MTPIVKILLLILFTVLFLVFSWPVIHQSKKMYKATKQRWLEQEDDAKELSRLLKNLEEENSKASQPKKYS